MPLVQKRSIEKAVANVSAFGDTDVFPFPFENWFIKECTEEIVAIIQNIDQDFHDLINNSPPQFESTLAPAGYTGFRWVTSIDPFWNLYFLSLVISIGHKIEAVRISNASETVFSYRFDENDDHHVFQQGIGWASFMEKSYTLSNEYKYVVATDISEFYRRINHHRLENALDQVVENEIPGRIMKILSLFSQKSSYGLPIGGPAARLLSEITINQIDKLLLLHKVKFTRFADDYHIFCDTLDDAYSNLQFLSESLIVNQGLMLQKSKTRIMSSGEFQHSFPKHLLPDVVDSGNAIESDTIKLLKLSISYDPYSPKALENYETLQAQLGEIDIVGLLTAESQKSQINLSVARRIVATIKHLSAPLKSQAISTLLENKEQFFPIMSVVLQMIYDVIKDAEVAQKIEIASLIRTAISEKTHVFGIDIHLDYAVRILSESGTEEDMLIISSLYDDAPSFLKRDIILVYAKAKYWYPLSALKSKYVAMTPWEQRAYFLSSYTLGDEGKYWREGVKSSHVTLDTAFRRWCSAQKAGTNTTIRL